MKKYILISFIFLGACTVTTGGEAPAADRCRWELLAKDYTRAIQTCRTAAMEGDSESQYELGRIYAEGLGTNRNYFLAYAWLSVASRNGAGSAYDLAAKVGKKLKSSERILAETYSFTIMNQDPQNPLHKVFELSAPR